MRMRMGVDGMAVGEMLSGWLVEGDGRILNPLLLLLYIGMISKVSLQNLPGSPYMYIYGGQDIVSHVREMTEGGKTSSIFHFHIRVVDN